MSESSIRKSQRRSYSCMTCKRRKVKCDRKLPCNQCLSRGLAHDCQREIVCVKGQITE
ncbi:hypothetical protein BJY01DRAFT_228576 [Aspergillus pseudoustus]|uniref:Zn(2)-C6 fungal-type domain-containing protein n=1 Tax=Aspergillus pseudoustus TaxID=1810923 RepID=A0ABR4IKP8_9EURO